MRKTEKDRYSYYELNGTTELFDFIKDTPTKNRSREDGYSARFCPYTFDETIESLKNGWREGTQEIQNITGKIQSAEGIYMGGHGIDYDVTGDFIDMGAYLTGEPECMGRIVPREIIKDEVYILVSTAYSCHVSERTIKTRGAAITALIEKLMEEYEVKLSFGNRVNYRGYYTKRAGLEMLLNINMQNEHSRDVIAFCAAHPGFLRRCIFALREKDLGKSTLEDSSYGISQECEFTIARLKKEGKKFYYFGKTMGNVEEWSSPKNALREVNRIVELLK